MHGLWPGSRCELLIGGTRGHVAGRQAGQGGADVPAGPDTPATRASLTVSVVTVAGLPGSHGTRV